MKCSHENDMRIKYLFSFYAYFTAEEIFNFTKNHLLRKENIMFSIYLQTYNAEMSVMYYIHDDHLRFHIFIHVLFNIFSPETTPVCWLYIIFFGVMHKNAHQYLFNTQKPMFFLLQCSLLSYCSCQTNLLICLCFPDKIWIKQQCKRLTYIATCYAEPYVFTLAWWNDLQHNWMFMSKCGIWCFSMVLRLIIRIQAVMIIMIRWIWYWRLGKCAIWLEYLITYEM